MRIRSPGKVCPLSPSANLPEVMHRYIAKMVTRTGIERGLQAKRLMTIFRECFWPAALNYKSAAVNSNQPQIKWVLPAQNPMRGATARDSRSVCHKNEGCTGCTGCRVCTPCGAEMPKTVTRKNSMTARGYGCFSSKNHLNGDSEFWLKYAARVALVIVPRRCRPLLLKRRGAVKP